MIKIQYFQNSSNKRKKSKSTKEPVDPGLLGRNSLTNKHYYNIKNIVT